MKTISAKELANELECNSVEDLFYTLIAIKNDNKIAAEGYFKHLKKDSQKQFLKYIDEFADMDDYNFFHQYL